MTEREQIELKQNKMEKQKEESGGKREKKE